MNKKIIFLIILTIFTFNIKNAYAVDFTDVITEQQVNENENTNQEVNETQNYNNEINDSSIDNQDETLYKEYKYINEETNYTAFIDDKANLLSLEEKEKLFEEMKPLTTYGHIGFVSTDNNSSSVNVFAANYYQSNFNNQSGTIFIIDMSNRKIYIVSNGANYRLITDSKAYSITDNVYKYASRQDYYGCASVAYKQVFTILNGGKIAEPMRYTSNLFISLTLALFFSFIFILSKSRIVKASLKSIVKNCDIEFEIGESSAIKTGSHRVYSPQSSGGSGGGSSGGGGGGGGGFSGGGGGHSF